MTLLISNTGRLLASPSGRLRTVPAEEFHVFLVAGQSNAHFGLGLLPVPDQVEHPRVKHFTTDGDLIPAVEPTLYFVYPGRIGFALAFGKAYVAQRPNVTAVITHYSGDGSSFQGNDWNQGDFIYTQAVNVANAAMASDPRFQFKGVLWQQGENDAVAGVTEASHSANLDAMIASMRADISGAGNSAFLAGQMSETYVANSSTALSAQLQEIQASIINIGNRVQNAGTVSSAGLTTSDSLHFDAASMRILGARYATAVSALDQTSIPSFLQWSDALAPLWADGTGWSESP